MDLESVYEVPSKFYLGKEYDLAGRKILDDLMMYDSKDLVTHALCVGMTGSGKTGLCLSLLEEAAIDGIPVICVDPKGDLGNLLLTFPELKGSDFEPWVDKTEAAQKDKTPAELAEWYANLWRKGLADWHQKPERIKKFRDSTDVTIYTPGSNIGVPLTVLKSFDAPAAEVISDSETFREKITSAASGLLTLLGIDADPLTSREHILLSKIFETSWMKGVNLSLADVIRNIQVPPIDRVGVIDLESFFSSADRGKFAMSLNNLLASPAFAGWLEGEPLNIKRLLYTDEGKPRISIISIAHLTDSERMFFVTILLGELLGWMRAQPGTGSLRALFYMDEVYGYFPPSAKPPSKPPMLTLLKQARAFGLGIALATQNPVDLDYKGLSNIGTWFLGRLQTDRDKQRVLDGLEGAAAQTGGRFDRAKMEQTLAALGARVFLMNNVHEDKPVIFQTRWALSFLRGPLSRQHVSDLMKVKREQLASRSSTTVGPRSIDSSSAASESRPSQSAALESARPIIPGDVTELFWVQSKFARRDTELVYLPSLLGQASLHFVKTAIKIDEWQDVSVLMPICGSLPTSLWDASSVLPAGTLQQARQPEEELVFGDMPIELAASRNYKGWSRDLQDFLYKSYRTRVYFAPVMNLYSRIGQSEMDARIEFSQNAREIRDKKVDELSKSFAAKISALESKRRVAAEKLAKEESEASGHFYDSMVQIGTSILGALVGRKRASSANVTRMSTAARKMSQVSSQKADVARAREKVEDLDAELENLKLECEAEIDKLTTQFLAERLELQEVELTCRKGDMQIDQVALLWVPFERDNDGTLTPLVELPEEAAAGFQKRRARR